VLGNFTDGKACIGKNFSEEFPIQNGLKQGEDLWSLLFNFALEYTFKNIQDIQKDWN
jgi:hypothetical protein